MNKESTNIELASSGVLQKDAYNKVNYYSYKEIIAPIELSDFEIVWRAAVSEIREARDSNYVLLAKTGNSIEWEPKGSHDPEEIRLFGGGDRNSSELTLGLSGPKKYKVCKIGDLYWGNEGDYNYTYSGQDEKTQAFLKKLADSILGRPHASENSTNHQDTINTNYAYKSDDQDLKDETILLPDPIEVSEIVSMMESVNGVTTEIITEIVAILKLEYEKLGDMYTDQNDRLILTNNMKRLLKVAMIKLHPDKDDGDAELFKIVSNVYETIKRDIINED